MREIVDREIYLRRLSAPMQEKLKVVRFFPENPATILDVGCADGAVTREIAKLFPNAKVLGIDLDYDFIDRAKTHIENPPNLSFARKYLRDLLAEPERFNIISFISVLHEFYTYGEGISSVMKAVADANELLESEGRIVIRDMILHESQRTATLGVREVLEKVQKRKDLIPYIEDHEKRFGKMKTQDRVNHFLLKYWYTENWEREGKENYIPVTFEQYQQLFGLLDMRVEYQDSYLIPFLRKKWVKDFELTDEEVNIFCSTGIIVATKTAPRPY